MDKSKAENFADTYIKENWGLGGLAAMKGGNEPWKSSLGPHWYMESKHCPVFKDTDPDLNEKIEECELKGSGYAIEVTEGDNK